MKIIGITGITLWLQACWRDLQLQLPYAKMRSSQIKQNTHELGTSTYLDPIVQDARNREPDNLHLTLIIPSGGNTQQIQSQHRKPHNLTKNRLRFIHAAPVWRLSSWIRLLTGGQMNLTRCWTVFGCDVPGLLVPSLVCANVDGWQGAFNPQFKTCLWFLLCDYVLFLIHPFCM